jgi:single-stranded DNA-binding protein
MNKCHFLGRVTDDIELIDFQGTSYVGFELEIEEYRKNKPSGDKKVEFTYLTFEAWDSAAYAISKYAKKDGLMAVEAIARNDHSLAQDNENPSDLIMTYFRVTNFKIMN